jgi:hypothetical protein
MLTISSRFLASCLLLIYSHLSAQQVADTLFKAHVGSPAYKEGSGPMVLLDEAHHNFHTIDGRYLAFARLVKRDGYDVRPNRERFTQESLGRAKILVIANALAKENETSWKLPTPSAFDSLEISAVRVWVNGGGSLWLISDHMPFPGAAGPLAAEFGITMVNGFAFEKNSQNGLIRYSRSDGSLADHVITRGRNSSESVESVIAFTGQGFQLRGGGEALMTLGGQYEILMPEVAWQFSRPTPRMNAAGMLQGAAIHFGKGRVAVFGEAAMFSAQVTGPNRNPMGMNAPQAKQNPQFLLNVLHWLDGLL